MNRLPQNLFIVSSLCRCANRKHFNPTANGFSVLVLLKVMPPDERDQFVKECTPGITAWCVQEIRATRNLMRKTEDLDRYKPSAVVILQGNEIEVFFEKKL